MSVTSPASAAADPAVARGDLLVVALPGVQRFISEAQSTSDVRAASEIVAGLVARAAGAALAAGATRIVLPDAEADAPATAEGMPNRVVVVASAGSGAALGREVSDAIHRQWQAWVRSALGLGPDAAVPSTEGFPAVQWVCVPESVGGYAQQWALAQRALTARRRVREFEPVEHAHRGDLCQLSPRWLAEPVDAAAPKHEQATLSAANWVKRRWQRMQGVDGFPSMASIASAPFRRKVLAALDDAEVAAAVGDLMRAARRVGARQESPVVGLPTSEVDPARWLARSGGPWVYPSSWQVERIAGDTGRTLDQVAGDVRDGRAAASRLGALMGKREVAAPATYLAVLVQDVDGMGRFLAGDGPDAAGRRLGAPDPTVHAQVSGRLRELSGRQRDELERNWLGVPVYAGGDDLLAFVPAVHALDAARACHDLIPDTLPRASTALHFAHVQGGLQSAITTARGLLEHAKATVDGKHALAVGFERRSGTATASVQRWLADDGSETAAAFLAFARGREQTLSPRLLQDLVLARDELAGLARIRSDLYLAELVRLTARHLDGPPATARDRARPLADALVRLGSTERGPDDSEAERSRIGPERVAQVGVFLRQEAR